jgi:shikimate dehydrogenase
MTDTYRFALLGDPVAHSRSPDIHRVMLQLSGLDGHYETIRADKAILAETVTGLRYGTWDGLNVTMPLKTEAAGLADTLSPQARRSRSVNTLHLSGSGVHGDSTDSITFRELTGRAEFSTCSSMLILGAGASAAAALAAIESAGPIYVSARRPAQAEELTGRLGGEPVAWGAAVSSALVINTTPIGMAGEDLPHDVLRVAAGLLDLPYGPTPTPAVMAASRFGIPTVDGHEFLIRQAMASFAIWTGREVDYDRVASKLRKV